MIVKQEHVSEEFNVEKYLKEHENKEMLRFITCGSVDDGKSTLIGRLLHDTKMIFEDQLAAIEKDSKKCGTTGDRIDLALLVDGLQSEREQGITIDVAYRFFTTDRRKFIIADTPGHEQYTRNMATGASTAELAIILIDARKGVLTQTRRHSYIASLLGIKNIIVTINKMDLVDYSQEIYEDIKKDYELNVIPNLPGSDKKIYYLPISALEGDNVVEKSANTPYYGGKTLIELLDTIKVSNFKDDLVNDFRFPVQFVNRPHLDFRGYAGTIAGGRIRVGDEIMVLPSKKTTRIKKIVPPAVHQDDKNSVISIDEAFAPMAVTLTLEEEIDVKRGDMIVPANRMPNVSDSFEVMVVWMNEEPLKEGNGYIIKRSTTVLNGVFSKLLFKKDINNFDEIAAESLHLNEIGCCEMNTDRLLAGDSYDKNRQAGGFIIIDRHSNNTLGAGMIINSLQKQSDKKHDGIETELNAFIRRYFPDWGCKKL
jgi:sulfate adenylyltransferase subunit 1